MIARADITHVDRGAVSRITGTGAIRSSPRATSGGKLVRRRCARPSAFARDRRTIFPEGRTSRQCDRPGATDRNDARPVVRTQSRFRRRRLAGSHRKARSGESREGIRRRCRQQSSSMRTRSSQRRRALRSPGLLRRTAADSIRRRCSANIVADVQSSTYDTLSVTSATVRLSAANGMARVDTLAVLISAGCRDCERNVRARTRTSGELRYHVVVDSLNRLASLFPPAEPVSSLRGREYLRAAPRARAPIRREEAKATEVERAATRKARPSRMAAVDTPQAVSRTQLSGSLRADGVATGNIHDFGVKGTASGENIVARGNTVAALHAPSMTGRMR